MRAKIGFLALLIGGAGLDGTDYGTSVATIIIGLVILLFESKKIDAPRPKRTSINNTQDVICAYFSTSRKDL